MFMKNLMLVALFVSFSVIAFSQMVDTTTYIYCRAVSISKNKLNLLKEDEVEITIDFGSGKVYSPKNPMKDENGKDANFENVVDLLNFMGNKKWLLEQAYQLYYGNSNVIIMTNFIFKKPKYGL